VWNPREPANLGLNLEIIELVNSFPFGLRNSPYTKHIFLPFVPTREVALALTDRYFKNVAWMWVAFLLIVPPILMSSFRYDPIVRHDFMNNIISPIYGSTGTASVDTIHSHRLSVFFILLASGCTYDAHHSATLSAERYYALSRAALALDSILQEATCATVQALFMMVRYIYISDCTGYENRWLLFGICTRVAQMVNSNLFESKFKLRCLYFCRLVSVSISLVSC
jgi:hypothetical protein